MALHDEQGISRTSLRDVAGRAGVSPATVLRQFGDMSRLIEACGRLSDELYPMPTVAAIAGARDRADAVRLMALALFTWWERFGIGWDHLQVDRLRLPEVDGWLRNVHAQHRGLAGAALGEDVGSADVAVLTALTSNGAWRALRDVGMDPAQAAAVVARSISKGGVS